MIVWQVVFFGHSWYGTILLYKDMGVVILPLEKACMAIGGLSVNLNRKKLSVVYWYDLLILNIHYLIFITLSVYLVTSCHNQTGYLWMLLFMNTDKNITTGKLVIDVAYFIFHVHSETHNFCDETSCPATGDFELASQQTLPSFTPPVSITSTTHVVQLVN